MAKRTTSRLEMRKMAEAAESQGKKGEASDAPVKKKSAKDPKAKKPAVRAKRTKTKVIIRKRLVWGVFSSSLKEEGRFPYAERAAADARAEDLATKHKRAYFVQGIKEPLPEKPAAPAEPKASKKAAAAAE